MVPQIGSWLLSIWGALRDPFHIHAIHRFKLGVVDSYGFPLLHFALQSTGLRMATYTKDHLHNV